MSWIAPEITRIDEPFVGDELTMLNGLLDWHRTTLLSKCAGLTPAQLAQWAVPPSSLSLLGLVRHLAEVERAWFRRRAAGEDVPMLHASQDACFDGAEAANAEADYATLLAEWDACRKAMIGIEPDREFSYTFHGETEPSTLSVRWIYLHLIEEYARHNGHADLLRERIDGVTGD